MIHPAKLPSRPASALLGALFLLAFALPGLSGLAAETTPASAATPGQPLDEVYTALLRDHVSEGWVDYAALQNDPRLARYIASLQNTDPTSFTSEDAERAFWLNVYNAFTLKLIVENYPLDSINDLHFLGSLYVSTPLGLVVWKTWEFEIHGETYTLDHVEHGIIRPRYQDYRDHAALVCAAVSCPPLRSEAYTGANLDEQLDDQMRTWLGNSDKNWYNAEEQKLYLSAIFSWFRGDFLPEDAPESRTLVDVVLPYLPEETAEAVRRDRENVRIRYAPHDWTLNGTSFRAEDEAKRD